MSRCILFDHQFQIMDGVGEHAGKKFAVCIECGKTKPVVLEIPVPNDVWESYRAGRRN